MNKNLVIGVLVLVLVGVGGYLVMQKGKPADTGEKMGSNNPVETSGTMEKSTGSTGEMTSDPNAKLFTVEGGKFYFKPNTITVKKGDTVTITFNNKEGLHDWVVDEFSARTKQIKDGETDKVTFVADKVGTFEYYCSVMQHRKMGMVGKLIVEE